LPIFIINFEKNVFQSVLDFPRSKKVASSDFRTCCIEVSVEDNKRPEKGLDELKEYLNVRVQQKDYSEVCIVKYDRLKAY
jgi:hypothetical protein